MNNTQFPENGFYVHYKHDPQGEPYNYMYEVVGIGRNTETKTYTVLYRPLYENNWMPPANFQSRPIELFSAEVDWKGEVKPRFIKISDTKLISELENQRELLYRV